MHRKEGVVMGTAGLMVCKRRSQSTRPQSIYLNLPQSPPCRNRASNVSTVSAVQATRQPVPHAVKYPARDFTVSVLPLTTADTQASGSSVPACLPRLRRDAAWFSTPRPVNRCDAYRRRAISISTPGSLSKARRCTAWFPR